jgi:hypothetical protein
LVRSGGGGSGGKRAEMQLGKDNRRGKILCGGEALV